VPAGNLEIDVLSTASAAVVQLAGDLDLAGAPRLRTTISHLVAEGARHIIIDLRAAEFVDAAGLGVLVQGYRLLSANGGKLAVTRPPDSVMKIFTATGLIKAVPMFSTPDEAMLGA
jgi:anti-sigma B factor antagonist